MLIHIKKLKYSFLFKFLIQFNLKFKINRKQMTKSMFFLAPISMPLLIQCIRWIFMYTRVKLNWLARIKKLISNFQFNNFISSPVEIPFKIEMTFLRKKKKKKKSAKAWKQIDRTKFVSPIDGRIPRLPVSSKRYQFHRTLDFSWEPMQRRQITEMQRHVQR